jgi:hypothetical protein
MLEVSFQRLPILGRFCSLQYLRNGAAPIPILANIKFLSQSQLNDLETKELSGGSSWTQRSP